MTRRPLVLLALLSLGCGSSVATGATAALKTATVVIDASREVRRYLCHRALDPLLGDPRAEAAVAPPSSGGASPAAPAAPAAPPPPVPSAPTLPQLPEVAPPVVDAGAPAGLDGGA